MADLSKTIIHQQISRLVQRKDQGGAAFRDLMKLVAGAHEGFYAHGLLARRRWEHMEETISPVHKRLGEIIIPAEKPRAEISKIWENLGDVLWTIRAWKEEEVPCLSEGLFFYAAYDVTQIDVAERRPTLEEDPDRRAYEAIVTERDQLKAVNSNLTRRLDDAVRARDEAVRAQGVVQAALTARIDGRLRMTESYKGVVRHVGRDDVVVLFEVDDDLVEHTYARDQFVDSRLPEQGDHLAVYVHVAQLPHEESVEGADKTTEKGIDELRRSRRNILRGEEEF